MRIIYDDLDFDPPFANQEQEEEVSDTYQAITVNLTAENVEFLVDMWIEHMSNNVEVFDNEEFQKMDEIWALIKPGIIPGKKSNPENPA